MLNESKSTISAAYAPWLWIIIKADRQYSGCQRWSGYRYFLCYYRYNCFILPVHPYRRALLKVNRIEYYNSLAVPHINKLFFNERPFVHVNREWRRFCCSRQWMAGGEWVKSFQALPIMVPLWDIRIWLMVFIHFALVLCLVGGPSVFGEDYRRTKVFRI